MNSDNSQSAGYFSVDEDDQLFDDALAQLEMNDDSGNGTDNEEVEDHEDHGFD